MQKPTEYKLEDSNVENIGSIMDKAARVSAAMTEDCWKGAGQAPGLEIWRVRNVRTESDTPDFGIERVPEEEYRQFFRGDSYILLYTYQQPDSDALLFNVHFWIGSESTADEYGVAAYKTVELDDLLGGVPIQYREMEGYESELFMSYFKPKGVCPGDIEILEGGYASGFRHVVPEEYKPRLLWVRKEDDQMLSSEVPVGLASLNQGDCFILDSGTKFFVFRGDSSSPFEKNKAISVAKKMEKDRGGTAEVIEVAEEDPEFWTLIGAKMGDPVPPPIEHQAPHHHATVSKMELYSLHDDTLEFVKVAEGPFKTEQLRDDDVMLINAGEKVFVVVGSSAPVKEKASAMLKAQALLGKMHMPMQTQICRVMAGQQITDEAWTACFVA